MIQLTQPPIAEPVAEALERSQALSLELHRLQPHTFANPPTHDPDGSEIPGAAEECLRIQLSTALFSIALDHHVAVTVLLQYGMRGSAFALLRAIFDAVWRGAWAGWVAPKENLDSFAMDRYDPTPHKAIKTLEERLELPPVLSQILDKGWQSMSAYTHGGALHVQRWVGDGVIEPRHSDEEVIEVLDLADRLAFAACWFFLAVTGMEQDVLDPVGAQFLAATPALATPNRN